MNAKTIASTTYYRLADDSPQGYKFIVVPAEAQRLIRFLETPKADRSSVTAA
jgi:hypothetical protein